MTVILKCAMAARVAAAAAVAAASAPRRATLSSVRTADLRQSNSLSAALRRSKSHNCAAQALICLPLRMSCARVLSQQRKVATLASSLTTDAPTSQGDSDEPKRVVFLGTPQECVPVLEGLLAARGTTKVSYEISAVVTQPPRQRRRGRKTIVEPTPVAKCAEAAGIPEEYIWWPEKAKDEEFLAKLQELKPHLCVTAAYGNFLPQSFLDIPEFGTVNIHPSLLPLYRGAAPVQRAIEEGVPETGVSVAFTVLKMDAGPIIAAETKQVDDVVTTADLLPELFAKGTALLLKHLDGILVGDAATYAKAQNENDVTHTAKLSFEEGLLLPMSSARALHNKVRAFVGWPSTRIDICVQAEDSSFEDNISLKILETRVVDGDKSTTPGVETLEDGIEAIRIEVDGVKKMMLRCLDGSQLELVTIQPTGKKAMKVSDFLNGKRGRTLFWPLAPLTST